MSHGTHTSAEFAPTTIEVEAQEVIAALRTLKPKDTHRKSRMFALLYPVIVALKEEGVTQKSILEMLAEKGLKLHPARFKEMMLAEAEKSINTEVDPASANGEDEK